MEVRFQRAYRQLRDAGVSEMATMDELIQVFGEPISIYTRAQGIEDGVLVDVTEWASNREMMGGFTVPVAMTAALWAKVVAPKGSIQDTRGRAHDVLWLASLAVRRRQEYYKVKLGNRVPVLRVVVDGDGVTIGYPADF
uniref:Uncharacterized protein n=1 Tax=viral metagenome TaxID=1070528 RepID=A0A6M3LHU9_9ZZZZ